MKLEWKGDKAIKATEEATQRALTGAAVIVHGAAVLMCPVDTGNLRSSINFKVEGDTAKIGTNVEYAPYVEYMEERGAKAKTTKNAMAKNPFLRPALDMNEKKVLKYMKETIANAIKR